ncbi:hypothetical protein H257_04227 [Aphanomyces astaci]|uniref:Uncharacterized protein n=1 Tax=Aphanomyces astaci TaxID=112090 RepID=W4GX71_APHAT|nr:hypothetical protein H257_04227 [Aphanomyces astaci]ETV83513.1 hypothetical protein H257_04227 [Aphanomyces astaci]|eukprot:XP_009826943.1 hypothetical protein H257_04227 [Aphanomyces astaci]
MSGLNVLIFKSHRLEFFSDTALPFTADVYWSATVMIIEWPDDVLVGHYGEGATVVSVAPALGSKPPRLYSRKRSVSFFKAGEVRAHGAHDGPPDLCLPPMSRPTNM